MEGRGSLPAAQGNRDTSEQQPGRTAPGAASLEASLPKEARHLWQMDAPGGPAHWDMSATLGSVQKQLWA